ncbi:MAG: hypothetical protein EON93_19175 [Burkholderiales bacterium]|nr:MAG: hypothetical protein EON93_19175 [Burkholderiales bacterium]
MIGSAIVQPPFCAPDRPPPGAAPDEDASLESSPVITFVPTCSLPARTSVSDPLLSPVPWVGPGAVHAAELEKSAQKGMRLLIDSRVMSASIREPVQDFAVRGSPHFEVNWLKSGLNRIDRDRLTGICAELMSEGTNYSQQLSASLIGLLRWPET